jgi:PAS domain S-box-containing protein
MANPNPGREAAAGEGLDRTLVLGISLVVLLIIGTAILSAYNVHRLRNDAQLVDHTHEAIATLEAVIETVRDAESGQRGYIITGNRELIDPYLNAPAIAEDFVERVEDLTRDNPAQRARIRKLRELVRSRLDTLFANVKLRDEDGFDAASEAIATNRGKVQMDALRDHINVMQTAERSLLIMRIEQSVNMYYTTLMSILLGTVLGLLAITGFLWMLRRNWLERSRAAAQIREQREQLRTTLASIGDAVIATDTEARIVFVNPVAASLTGWSADDARGQPLKAVLRLINEYTRQPAANPVDRVLAEGVIVGLANHTLLIRRDGVEIPIDDSAAPIRNQDGEMMGCVLVFRDISERKESGAEIERLLASEKRRAEQLRKLADAALTLNSATTRDSVLGVVAAEARLVFDAEQVKVQLGGCAIGEAESPVPASGEINGDIALDLPTSGLVVPLVARNGEPFGYLQIDRTDRGDFDEDEASILAQLAHMAAVAVQNAQLYEELRIANHRKNEFLATLAHELRNPLAPIRYSLELMQLSENDADAQRESRTIIARQVTQMVRLIDDLLDVSRISRGKIELRPERVTLHSVIAAAREASGPIIADYRHEFIVEVPEDPIWIQADPTRLAQVLLNVLNNAAKYTPAGGRISLTVTKTDEDSASGDRGGVAIHIRDNGVGIPTDMLGQVFEMFTQVDRSLDRSQGGLGIGLTLVRRLVELHGGSVEAHSDGPGKGSEFIVRLPLIHNLAKSEEPINGEVSSDAASTRTHRILAVDDNQDAVDILARTLQLKGHEVQTAYDGIAAVDVAARFKPEIVLLDIGLPRLSGYDVARRIRQQPGGDAVTLIAITGWGQEEDRRQSEQSGFDLHLVKPVDPIALLKLLAELPPKGSRMRST